MLVAPGAVVTSVETKVVVTGSSTLVNVCRSVVVSWGAELISVDTCIVVTGTLSVTVMGSGVNVTEIVDPFSV